MSSGYGGLTVVLKGGQPWGFRLGGGDGSPVTVLETEPGGKAAGESGLRIGDQVLRINDVFCSSVATAQQLIESAFRTLTLAIWRGTTATANMEVHSRTASLHDTLTPTPTATARGQQQQPAESPASDNAFRHASERASLRAPLAAVARSASRALDEWRVKANQLVSSRGQQQRHQRQTPQTSSQQQQQRRNSLGGSPHPERCHSFQDRSIQGATPTGGGAQRVENIHHNQWNASYNRMPPPSTNRTSLSPPSVETEVLAPPAVVENIYENVQKKKRDSQSHDAGDTALPSGMTSPRDSNANPSNGNLNNAIIGGGGGSNRNQLRYEALTGNGGPEAPSTVSGGPEVVTGSSGLPAATVSPLNVNCVNPNNGYVAGPGGEMTRTRQAFERPGRRSLRKLTKDSGYETSPYSESDYANMEWLSDQHSERSSLVSPCPSQHSSRSGFGQPHAQYHPGHQHGHHHHHPAFQQQRQLLSSGTAPAFWDADQHPLACSHAPSGSTASSAGSVAGDAAWSVPPPTPPYQLAYPPPPSYLHHHQAALSRSAMSGAAAGHGGRSGHVAGMMSSRSKSLNYPDARDPDYPASTCSSLSSSSKVGSLTRQHLDQEEWILRGLLQDQANKRVLGRYPSTDSLSSYSSSTPSSAGGPSSLQHHQYRLQQQQQRTLPGGHHTHQYQHHRQPHYTKVVGAKSTPALHTPPFQHQQPYGHHKQVPPHHNLHNGDPPISLGSPPPPQSPRYVHPALLGPPMSSSRSTPNLVNDQDLLPDDEEDEYDLDGNMVSRKFKKASVYEALAHKSGLDFAPTIQHTGSGTAARHCWEQQQQQQPSPPRKDVAATPVTLHHPRSGSGSQAPYHFRQTSSQSTASDCTSSSSYGSSQPCHSRQVSGQSLYSEEELDEVRGETAPVRAGFEAEVFSPTALPFPASRYDDFGVSEWVSSGAGHHHPQQPPMHGHHHHHQPDPTSGPASPPPPIPPVRDSSSLLKYAKYGAERSHDKYPSWPVTTASQQPPHHHSQTSLDQPSAGGANRVPVWNDGSADVSPCREKSLLIQQQQLVRSSKKYAQSFTQQLKTVVEKTEKSPAGGRGIVQADPRLIAAYQQQQQQITSPPNKDVQHGSSSHDCDPLDRSPPPPYEREPYHSNSSPERDLTGRRLVRNGGTRWNASSPPGSTASGSSPPPPYSPESPPSGPAHRADETPLMDRLRLEGGSSGSDHSGARSGAEVANGAVASNGAGGRDSITSTTSSQETLKWHGSGSDLSVHSGGERATAAKPAPSSSSSSSSAALESGVVHSARVLPPQRHNSESVLYYGVEEACAVAASCREEAATGNSGDVAPPLPRKMRHHHQQQQQQWSEQVQKNNTRNRLQPATATATTVTTRTHYQGPPAQPHVRHLPANVASSSGLAREEIQPPLSPEFAKPLSVAERVQDLERQARNNVSRKLPATPAPGSDGTPPAPPTTLAATSNGQPQQNRTQYISVAQLQRRSLPGNQKGGSPSGGGSSTSPASSGKEQRMTYLDPEKKHKISDPKLKAIQKEAVLSFYQRRSGKDVGSPRQCPAATSAAAAKDGSPFSAHPRLAQSLPRDYAHEFRRLLQLQQMAEDGRPVSGPMVAPAPSSPTREDEAPVLVRTSRDGRCGSPRGPNDSVVGSGATPPSSSSSSSASTDSLASVESGSATPTAPSTPVAAAPVSPVDKVSVASNSGGSPEHSGSPKEYVSSSRVRRSRSYNQRKALGAQFAKMSPDAGGPRVPSSLSPENSESIVILPSAVICNDHATVVTASATERRTVTVTTTTLTSATFVSPAVGSPPTPPASPPASPPALTSRLRPPVSDHLLHHHQDSLTTALRCASPDLPLPPPPPPVEHHDMLTCDEPLPPPPTLVEMMGDGGQVALRQPSSQVKSTPGCPAVTETGEDQGSRGVTVVAPSTDSPSRASETQSDNSTTNDDIGGLKLAATKEGEEPMDTTLSPCTAWEQWHNIRQSNTTLVFHSGEMPPPTATSTGHLKVASRSESRASSSSGGGGSSTTSRRSPDVLSTERSSPATVAAGRHLDRTSPATDCPRSDRSLTGSVESLLSTDGTGSLSLPDLLTPPPSSTRSSSRHGTGSPRGSSDGLSSCGEGFSSPKPSSLEVAEVVSSVVESAPPDTAPLPVARSPAVTKIGRLELEELECERLSRDLVGHLSVADDALKFILVPTPHMKTTADYMEGLFDTVDDKYESSRRPDRSSSCSSSSTSSSVSPLPSSDTHRRRTPQLPGDSAYFTTSESKARFLTRYGQNVRQSTASLGNDSELTKKKEELIVSIGRKLQILSLEQLEVREEMAANNALGAAVGGRIEQLAKSNEVDKFRLHVEEVEKITNLLLGLSGRLARADNALATLPDDTDSHVRVSLEGKQRKLSEQLEEAKKLKESIDRRSHQVAGVLRKYLSSDEYADYDHFVRMKAKLLMDARELDDRIKLGQEQMAALRESLGTS